LFPLLGLFFLLNLLHLALKFLLQYPNHFLQILHNLSSISSETQSIQHHLHTPATLFTDNTPVHSPVKKTC
jgi:hypothetical protein